MLKTISRRRVLAAASAAPVLVATSYGHAAGSTRGQARLFFTPAVLDQARRLKDRNLVLAWRKMRTVTEAAHRAPLPRPSVYVGWPDPGRMWQRDVGNTMATLAAAFLLDGEAADLELAIAWACEAARYPVWGEDRMDGADLAAGHLLFGMAMVLDWVGDFMPPATRALLVATLRRRGAQMEAAATGRFARPAYWSMAWRQNHLWVNMTGLFAAGLALDTWAPDLAPRFMTAARERLIRAFATLPPDGSSQEGPGYWDYGAEYLLKFHHLATEAHGMALASPWLRNAASYRAAMTLPLSVCQPGCSMINQADSPISPWYGPEYHLRRLAALNRDGAAQALAAHLEAVGATCPSAPWLNFVWFDASVAAVPGMPPLLRHFDDLGLVVSRGDRSGREAMVAMRAGPPLGRRAQAGRYVTDVGLGHVHPDVNHITLFGAGQFLLRDDGYADIKQTARHNTLLVDGVGQIGEGGHYAYFPHLPLADAQPELQVVASGPAFDYWVGQGAAAYPASAGLTRFDRHVVFVRPDVLIVVDDLAAARSVTFTLLWHPGGPALPLGPWTYQVNQADAVLRIALVTPPPARPATARRVFLDSQRVPQSLDEISVDVTGSAAQCGAVFTWGPPGTVGAARLIDQSGSWLIQTPGSRLQLTPALRRLVRV